MADGQKPADRGVQPQGTQDTSQPQEAGAADLLSLWGASGAGVQQTEPAPKALAKVEPKKEIFEKEIPRLTKEQEPTKEPGPTKEQMLAQTEKEVELLEVEPAEVEPAEVETVAAEPEKDIFEEKQETASEEKIESEQQDEKNQEETASRQERPEKAEESFRAEVISPDADVIEQPPEVLEEDETFKEKLNEFFRELNISKKHIFYGIGCLIIIIVFVIGGLKGWSYIKNRRIAEPAQNAPAPKPPAEISAEDIGLVQTVGVGRSFNVNAGLVADTGINSAVSIGTEFEAQTELVRYILTFRNMQNAYQTDVEQLLNQSTDRRARLNSYLALLRTLTGEGTSTLQSILGTKEIIRTEYEEKQRWQETNDAIFFQEVNSLNAQTAQDILNNFIDVSQDLVDLKARFKALQKMQFLYEQALPRMISRIRSIELNQDALVAGIKVYQVGGSNLNLVVPVSGQETETNSLQETPSSSFNILPTHPSQVQTGIDYITQPGGGFPDVFGRNTGSSSGTTSR